MRVDAFCTYKKKMKRVVFLMVFLFVANMLQAQKPILSIQFNGLKKTKKTYLQKFINLKEGVIFNKQRLANDVQALRNLNLFLNVKVHVTDSLEGVNIDYQLDEALSILPIINFGGIKDNFWFQLGVTELNWHGKGKEIGGYYRYDEKHSFQIFQKTPYINSSKWGYGVSLSKFSSVEPIFIKGEAVDYNFDNYTIEVLPSYEFIYGNDIQFGFALLGEKYEPIVAENSPLKPFSKKKVIFKVVHNLNKIDYLYQYLNGFSNQIFAETALTFNSDEFFWKITNEFKFFKRVGGKGNIATRARLGIATSNGSPFAPFVLDSYINIRGVGNKVARGSGELVLNLEYRQTLFDNEVCAIQGVAFSDIGSWRGIGESFNSLFGKEGLKVFSGIGTRFYSKKIYNLILRIDYAVNLENKTERGFVFGVQQYF